MSNSNNKNIFNIKVYCIHIIGFEFVNKGKSSSSITHSVIYLFIASLQQILNFLPFIAVLLFICLNPQYFASLRLLSSDLVFESLMYKTIHYCNLYIYEL